MNALHEQLARWLQVVQDDLDTIINVIDGPLPNRRIASYHAQQAIEKLIKTCIIFSGNHPLHSHSLVKLLDQLPDDFFLKQKLAEFVVLDVYCHVYRYPVESDEEQPAEPEVKLLRQWHNQLQALKSQLMDHIAHHLKEA